jgi:phage shock protein A
MAGDNMNDKVLEEITVGLSEAEKNDLENMIKAFRKQQASAPATSASASASGEVHKQFVSMSENLAKFGDILLKFDTKIKLLHKILSLSDKKNHIMNQRIDAIIEMLKEQKILSEK